QEAGFRKMTKYQKDMLENNNPFNQANNSISDEDNHTDDKFIVHQHTADLLTCTNGRANFNSELIGKAVVKCSVKISNQLEQPVAFKIKSTSSRLFHIKTPRGVLQPAGNTIITISFRGSFMPTDLAHYIGIFGVILDEKNAKEDPKKIFDDKRDKEDFMRRMFISYSKMVKQSDTYLSILRNMKPVEPKSG
ncbi:hypothetical protein PENTCL1PPCAC_4494, partial [Pristionchus entomophagus]